MLLAVASGMMLAVVVPFIYRVLQRHTGWVVALLPAGLFAYFIQYLMPTAAGEVVTQTLTWVPSLDVALHFKLDALSLVFALLITGIGTFIMIFATGYFAHDPNMPRFYVVILIFMAAMLGLVLANDLILVFIFWELTSISSYLLIGYKHTKTEAQDAARRALIITGLGGLAMLAGFILLGIMAGTTVISELEAQHAAIIGDVLYLPMLILVLLGAFTKSAQFPFHFWLPGAMAAPTPVSAYLHSATMVKAGVYLIARLSVAIGGTQAWLLIVTSVGAITMVVAAYLAIQMYDLKKILAYSTVSALGIMVMLFGLGNPYAVRSAIAFIVVHSLYKGAMFMVAGTIDHEAGTRDIRQLGGLFSIMPVLGIAMVLAAISKAGIPPALGFYGKELIYAAALNHNPIGVETWVLIITGAAFLSNVLISISGWLVTFKPFFSPKPADLHPHAAPFTMAIGPIVLGIIGMGAGFIPKTYANLLINPGASAVLGETSDYTLYFPTEVNEIVILSGVTIVLGLLGYALLRILRPVLAVPNVGEALGPGTIYDKLYHGTLNFAEAITRRLQTGNMRQYIFVIVLTFAGLMTAALALRVEASQINLPTSFDARFYEVVLGLVIIAAVYKTISTRRVLVAVIGLGVIGYCVAMIFMLFSAPDLAMTQFSVETLSVILFVLVLYKFPDFDVLSADTSRLRDAILAGSVGVLISLTVLIVGQTPLESRVSPYFLEASVPEALGQNVVNVILVDFRALDTMGEITVIAVAAIGVFALLKLVPSMITKEEPLGED